MTGHWIDFATYGCGTTFASLTDAIVPKGQPVWNAPMPSRFWWQLSRKQSRFHFRQLMLNTPHYGWRKYDSGVVTNRVAIYEVPRTIAVAEHFRALTDCPQNTPANTLKSDDIFLLPSISSWVTEIDKTTFLVRWELYVIMIDNLLILIIFQSVVDESSPFIKKMKLLALFSSPPRLFSPSFNLSLQTLNEY